MTRHDMIERVGSEYMTANIEGGEYSYVQEAGSREALETSLGQSFKHFKLDIRFEKDDTVVLIETKQSFKKSDEIQLNEYLQQEKALHCNKKIIAILANTNDDNIKVWKSEIDEEHLLKDETILDKMDHYINLFDISKQNDREKVLKNTYDLNELLHKMDINERLRSQFVGTTLLYLKNLVEKFGEKKIDNNLRKKLDAHWSVMDGKQLRAAIESTLEELLDGSDNKKMKIELLQKNVLNDQKVKKLSIDHWIKILDTILLDIYRYIDTNSSEGQDILNLFFIAFNKYTGKADRNQAFTPDHITEFMCRITNVDRDKKIFDGTCGSGSFLVQAMVKELADCYRDNTEEEAKKLQDTVKKEHIFGIEIEEKAYGLSTTNMLIHSDGNSNIKFGNLFDSKAFIKAADPEIILMNPPYNATPKGIPAKYKKTWSKKAKDGKTDPTKGFVFIHFISDVISEMNNERKLQRKSPKEVKMAVLLPVSAAIGSNSIIKHEKKKMLENNTLEAVFTLPDEVFYPGASASVCCMVFTLGKSHKNPDGTINETFFGYYKDDGFKKKKAIGRIEQFDENGNSIWKAIEEEWLYLYRNKKVIEGLSSTSIVDENSEWLCEAYMKTNYDKLCVENFTNTINNYMAYLVKTGKYPKLTNISNKKIDLNTSNWKEFQLKKYFKIFPGKYHYPDEYVIGTTPYLSASSENNSVSQYIDLEPEFEGNCIVTGKIGCTAFYISEPFCATSDVNIFMPKFNMSKHVGLFITSVINYSENYKWAYGRQCRVGNSKKIVVKLPKDANGEPNWEFMEDYIKSLPYGCDI